MSNESLSDHMTASSLGLNLNGLTGLSRNKRLVEVIDTGRPVLRFICILEDLPDD